MTGSCRDSNEPATSAEAGMSGAPAGSGGGGTNAAGGSLGGGSQAEGGVAGGSETASGGVAGGGETAIGGGGRAAGGDAGGEGGVRSGAAGSDAGEGGASAGAGGQGGATVECIDEPLTSDEEICRLLGPPTREECSEQAEDGWEGCYFGNCLVCPKSVVDYPYYFDWHPCCRINTTCASSEPTRCNPLCPAPTEREKSPPCFLVTLTP
jgi:hypothetical protein